MRVIARNRAVDFLRFRRMAPLADVHADELIELACPEEDTETTVLARVATQRTLKLVTALPPDQVEAILLRVVVGLTGKEAARVLGKRPEQSVPPTTAACAFWPGGSKKRRLAELTVLDSVDQAAEGIGPYDVHGAAGVLAVADADGAVKPRDLDALLAA